MLSWRARRQLSAIFVVVLFIGVVLALNIKRFIPAPTCFDNKKNQGEVEVDCGGPCAPCELRNPKPIGVFWARAVPIRQNNYDVAAFIQNPNEVLASANITYEFALFDSLGEIARRGGKMFIYPQEQVHVVEAGLSTTRQPSRVEFKITSADWTVFKQDRPSLIVANRNYKVADISGRRQSTIEATIQNRSALDLREVAVTFLILDVNGNLLGTNRTVVNNLNANTSQPVVSTWPEELKGDVGSIEVEPRVNIFDPTIILKPQ